MPETPEGAGGKRWAVEFERRADRDLERLDRKLRRRVIDAIETLARNPGANSNLLKLRGRDEHRLRVGEWRVLLALNRKGRTITVLRVRPRGNVYKP
jgi:mRNA interferase RelE/StbE